MLEGTNETAMFGGLYESWNGGVQAEASMRCVIRSDVVSCCVMIG